MVGPRHNRTNGAKAEIANARNLKDIHFKRKLSGVLAYVGKNKNLSVTMSVVALFAVAGTLMIVTSKAATYAVPKELEAGTPAGAYSAVSDTNASGGQYIKFGVGGGTTPPPTTPPTTDPTRTDSNCGGGFSGDIGGTVQTPPAGGGKTITATGDPSSSISSAAAGDTVLVPPGSYGALSINKSGSAGKCITVAGNGGIASFSGITIKGSYVRVMNVSSKGSGTYGWQLNSTNHITLANVKVEGSKNGGIQFSGASFILIDGCDVSGTNGGQTGSGEGEAISVADGTTDSEVRFCKVHNNGEEGIDVKYSNNKTTNVSVHDNDVYSNGGPNIYVDGVNGVKIYNNKSHDVYKKGQGKSGIMLGCESEWAPSSPSQNIEIYNNQTYNNDGNGITVYDGGCGIAHINVHDNTLSQGDKLNLGGATDVKQANNTIK